MSAGAGAALARVPADPEVARQIKRNLGIIAPPGEDDRNQTEKYIWTRADVLGIAKMGCIHCHGGGMSLPGVACKCVTRAIFRALMAEWARCQQAKEFISRCKVEKIMLGAGRSSRMTFSMPRQEFCADLELLARRALDAEHLVVWRAYHCEGADYQAGMRRTGLNKGAFFHAVYRVEDMIGRAAREMRPYPLYPIDEYFSK